MTSIESAPTDRTGKKHRGNPDRYFHIMTEGWYVFKSEGVRGPFYDKARATSYLQQHIRETLDQNDPSSTWRL
ncbi:MAG: hypothetical protein GC149_05800 [Gammaproteobacteria bacterium]|nr:hypothetical protein [Gammaproteobacteria bacterium]